MLDKRHGPLSSSCLSTHIQSNTDRQTHKHTIYIHTHTYTHPLSHAGERNDGLTYNPTQALNLHDCIVYITHSRQKHGLLSSSCLTHTQAYKHSNTNRQTHKSSMYIHVSNTQVHTHAHIHFSIGYILLPYPTTCFSMRVLY